MRLRRGAIASVLYTTYDTYRGDLVPGGWSGAGEPDRAAGKAKSVRRPGWLVSPRGAEEMAKSKRVGCVGRGAAAGALAPSHSFRVLFDGSPCPRSSIITQREARQLGSKIQWLLPLLPERERESRGTGRGDNGFVRAGKSDRFTMILNCSL